jgi:protein gp37
VWVGVSIEHRAEAKRAERLREVPAAVRFISAEPLEVDLGGIDQGDHRGLPVSGCVGRVGQADREPAVSSSALSTSSP